MSEKRLTYLDIASGIMTIWVIVFHAIYPMYGTDELKVIPWLYYFMPWFFYKAGMMFHPKEMKREISNGWNKLLKTFIIWSIIGWLAHVGWHWFVGDLTARVAFYSPLRSLVFKAQVPINGALWFLPILFIVRIIGNWLLNKGCRIEWLILSSALLVLICKLLDWRFMPIYIDGTAWGLFFFACGYLFKGNETNKWIASIAALLFIGSLFTDIPSVYCKSGTPLIQALWYPACLAGCITFNNVCRILGYAVEKLHMKNGILQYVGKNALNFYVPHKIIFHLGFNLIVLYKYEWYSTWQGLCLVLLASACVLTIVNLIINHMHKICSAHS